MEANHAYELLKQSIEMELSTMQKRMSAATSERSGGLQLSSKFVSNVGEIFGKY